MDTREMFPKEDAAMPDRPRGFATAWTFVARLIHVAVVAMTLVSPTHAADVASTTKPPDGNAVTHWNAVALDAFAPTEGTNPMAQWRTFAILHALIHDALNAIDRRFEAYTPGLAPARGAAIDAAVAAAARLTLPRVTRRFKGFSKAARENGLSRIYAGIHFRHAVRDRHRLGRSVGQAVARALEAVNGSGSQWAASR